MATIINMGGPAPRLPRINLSSDDDLSSDSSLGSQESEPFRTQYELDTNNADMMDYWRWTFVSTTERIVYRRGADGYEHAEESVTTRISASTTRIVANRVDDQTFVPVTMKDFEAITRDYGQSSCYMTMVFPSGSEVKISLNSEFDQVLRLCVDELRRI